MHLAWSHVMREAIKQTSHLGRLYKRLGLASYNERLVLGYVLNSLGLVSVSARIVSPTTLIYIYIFMIHVIIHILIYTM